MSGSLKTNATMSKMRTKINISILAMFVFSVLPGFSQEKELRQANADFNDLQYSKAAGEYIQALGKIIDDSLQKQHALFMLAECYRMMNDPDRAEVYYTGLISDGYGTTRPALYLRYANILLKHGDYSKARDYYKKYLEEDPVNQHAKLGVKSCDWMASNAGKRAQAHIWNLEGMNTAYDEFAPVVFSREFDKLMITSNRPGTVGKYVDEWEGQGFTDLFVTSKAGSSWNSPVSFDNSGKVNSEIHEGSPCFNADFTALYFTRCSRSEKKMHYCEIWKTKIIGDSLTPPEVVFADTASNMGQPTLSRDELTIYFSSDKKGGSGGNDIWTAQRASKDGKFGEPVNAGRAVNTVGEELFPYLYNDSALYFASDGFEGYGGLDLFRSDWKNGAWGKPGNLLAPINSGYDDFAIQVRIPGEEGFFASNRSGGKGQDDIYLFTKRTLLFSLDGHVKDQMTLLPMENAQVLLIGEKKDTAFALTNSLGYYSFDTSYVREGKAYELVFRKANYFAKKDGVSTKPYKDDHRFIVDAELEPIPDKPIVLPDILYALDDWHLQPQYEDSLRNLVKLMKDNESIVIELRSHTDSRASHKYNDTLSQKRAQSVVDFLVREGIEPGRMIAKGYGERVFRVLNKDITREGYTFPAGTELNDKYVLALPTKEIQEAAFQLNRRTEFAVIAKDYNPRNNAADSQITTIQMISDSSITAIDIIEINSEGVKEITIYLNDYGTRGVINPNLDLEQSVIGESIVLNWLKKGVVNRNDFTGKFEEIMVDGRIVSGSEMIIMKVRITDKVIDKVKVKIDQNVGDYILIGKDILSRAGEFTVDEEKKQLIFK